MHRGHRVVSTSTVAFVVYSTGKNGANAGAYGPHEAANTDGNAVFVSHAPSGADSATGTFDDLMVWVPAGTVYSRLISAGVACPDGLACEARSGRSTPRRRGWSPA